MKSSIMWMRRTPKLAGLLLTTGRASHPGPGRQQHHQKAQNTTDTAGRHRGYCYPRAPFTHSSIGGDDGGASTSSVHGTTAATRKSRAGVGRGIVGRAGGRRGSTWLDRCCHCHHWPVAAGLDGRCSTRSAPACPAAAGCGPTTDP